MDKKFTQAGRMVRVRFSQLGEDDLLLDQFNGTEAVSELFCFDLELLAELPLAAGLSFAKVVGQPITVTCALPEGGERKWHGLVRRFHRGLPVQGPDGALSFVRFRAEMVPHLWLLTKRTTCRIVQNKSVPDVLHLLFQGLAVDWSGLHGEYPRRQYVTQYCESDYAFACRLMEEEGISFSFRHDGEQDVLVLSDQTPGSANLPGPGTVHLDPNAEYAIQGPDCVWNWESSQELASGKFVLWDYLYQLADKNLGPDPQEIPAQPIAVGTAKHTFALAGNTEHLEVFDPPGRHAHHFSLGPTPDFTSHEFQELYGHVGGPIGARKNHWARLSVEREMAATLSCSGRGSCRQFNAGARFTLHSQLAAFDGSGDYLLTRVQHTANMNGTYTKSDPTTPTYTNEFVCLPVALTYRPPLRTPKPRIAGVQSAIVTGTPGEDVTTDAYGRVQVQFHWDRTATTGIHNQYGRPVTTFNYWPGPQEGQPTTSSCWVRVAQLRAGRKHGTQFIPRLGEEVAVTFHEGDPDQPLILGSLYNVVNQPPFPLPTHSLNSGWKSHTVGDKLSQFNGLRYDDTPGHELIQLHGARDILFESVNDTTLNVAGNYTINVGQTYTVKYGTLVGLQAPGDPAPKEPWQWSLPDGGPIQASVGKNLGLVYGESTSSVTGLAAALVFGNQFNYVVNPLSWLQEVAPNLMTVLAPIMGLAAGYNAWILGPALTMVSNANVVVQLGPSITVNVPTAGATAFRAFVAAAALLSTGEMLAFGGVGNQLSANWASGDTAEKAAGYSLTAGTGVFGVAMIGTMYQMMKFLYKDAAMQAATTAVKDAVSSKLMGLSEMVLGGAAQVAAPPVAPPPPAPPPQPTVQSCSGPYVLSAVGCSVNSSNGIQFRNQQQSAPGTTATINLGVGLLGGMQLSHSDPVQLPQLSLDNQGLTLQAGAPGAGSQISVTATGITLSFGPPNAGASIKLDSKGITLQVGPTNKIWLSTLSLILKGKILSLGTDGGTLVVNTANLLETVSGNVNRVGNMASMV